MTGILKKLEKEDIVEEAWYRAYDNRVMVRHTNDVFTETELQLIRDGKISPDFWYHDTIVYIANITLPEQNEKKINETIFNFEEE